MHPNFEEALDAGLLEEAFTHEDVTYYCATNSGANLGIKRYAAIGDLMRRHDELRLTDDVLTSSFKLMADLNQQQIKLIATGSDDIAPSLEVNAIIRRLQSRQSLGIDVQMVYELASLWYMSEDEDPLDYDPDINRKKVASWVRDASLYGRFASDPLGKFVPLQQLYEGATQSALRAMNQEEIWDLTRILLLKESLGLMPATTTTIESRRETLYGYDGLLSVPLSPTSNT
ncbi:hypothetical protein [Fibrivirga algicola]|uniref:Uncharacterized protein n=1 Tax=Fibrivirga algicola TaxID=2950420 RepID=A0ABX0QE74_9BACT|nr:hypothetical protein [Fibrivirga algicola]NID09397.1 hypothetical protein [Fibrivirga algicola]